MDQPFLGPLRLQEKRVTVKQVIIDNQQVVTPLVASQKITIKIRNQLFRFC
jgi:hypothetical protein